MEDNTPWAIKYFISYWANQDNNLMGYGRCEYNTDRPITGETRITEIEERLEKMNNYKKVIILHWKRFDA